jgi:hypothetical protein
MMPSIELRLQTMAKAMNEIILPAIAPTNGLAREQVQLMIAQIAMIGQHWQKAHAYDALALREIAALGRVLATSAAGGTKTEAAAAILQKTLQECDTTSASPAELRAVIADAIDKLVIASGLDGSDAFRQSSFDTILEHGALQAWRDRVWFAGCGMDPERADLPSIDEMLAKAGVR